MKPIYVGYYTKDNIYQSAFEKLEKQLKWFYLEHDFKAIDTLGSWQKNTQYKAKLLLRMYEKYKKRPMVYLDVDSNIVKYPVLFNKMPPFDMAVHYINWALYKKRGNRTGLELDSAVMYFANRESTERILKGWIQTCEKNPKTFDQKCLQMFLEKNKEFSVYNLPPQYCTIFDHMEEVIIPVIKQMQISRIGKKIK